MCSSDLVIKSNCLLEALKAKIINPKQNKIYKRDSWFCEFKKQHPHFYWYHKPHDKYYHYLPKDDIALSWFEQLWYEGEIVERKISK